jgi:hypothetical protein
MPYIGQQPTNVAFLTDTFSGTGSQTAYTLSAAPASTSSILVAVSGVLQDPSTYSSVGTTLTFSAAPPSGTDNISVRFLGIPASGVTTTAYRTVTEFTATASQTTFSVPSYTVGFIDVYRNGVMLGSADYTATNGTTVVLATGATVGDLVEVISFQVSSVLNAIPNSPASVQTSNLVDGSVTAAKLASGAALSNLGTSQLADANMPAGSVLQVVQTFKSDTTSASNAASLDTWVDISGISVSITPTSASNKILVLMTLNIGTVPGQSVAVQILRNSTAIGNGDASSNRLPCFADIRQRDEYECELYSGQYLDSPATTSALTYKIQWRKPYDYDSGGSSIYLNRSNNDGDSNDRPRCSSSITVMEIAG